MDNPQTRSVTELTIRRMLCDKIMRALIDDCAGDPRQPDALEHYRAQLKALDKELAAAQKLDRQARGIPEPEPVVVNLKPGRLFGLSPSIKKE